MGFRLGNLWHGKYIALSVQLALHQRSPAYEVKAQTLSSSSRRITMAFVTGPALPSVRTPAAASVCNKHVRMSAEPMSRRAALSAAFSAAAAVVALPLAANANIEYANVGFLGGGDKIDVNNANIRSYVKYPGAFKCCRGRATSIFALHWETFQSCAFAFATVS